MAAKKKKREVTLATAALAHGKDASGAQHLKPGFAFTPEMDLAFALGYPHFVYLADGHPADDDPLEAGLAFIDGQYFQHLRTWPREIASRAARSYAYLDDKDDDRTRQFSRGGPVTEDEARHIIPECLDCFHSETLLLLLEALVGPDVVCSATIDSLEGYEDEHWHDSDFDTALYHLGFILLRLPSDAAARARIRLESLYQRVKKAGWSGSALECLDCVVHGVEGAERSAYRPDGDGTPISSMFVTNVVDEPSWVAETVLRGGPPDESVFPDPRLVFLGGDEVLSAECSWWKKYVRPGAHALFVERFGHVQSTTLLPVFLEMTKASKAKREAKAWFNANADFARPFLEDETRRGNASAQAVLKAIG